MKCIPSCKKVASKKTFAEFNESRRIMNNEVFFQETTPGIFVRNKKLRIKSNFWPVDQYKEIDDFFCKIRDGIALLKEDVPKEMVQNLSNQEFSDL